MMHILLLTGFLLLIKGTNSFAEDNSSVAKLLWVPTVIVGLTIVAFGTSASELMVSISAPLSESNGIAMGNVTGSNIFNLLVVVGACGVIMPMAVDKMILYGDYLFSILAAAVMLALFAFDRTLSRLDGMILLLLFAYFLYKMMRNTLTSRAAGGPEEDDVGVLSPVKSVLFILGGLAVIIAGDNVMVNSASSIVSSFGLDETLIDLTVVAFGTSLPKLAASVMASRKGENGLALDNVIGPNLFNILSVLAVSATVSPMKMDILPTYDVIFLIAVSIITWFLAKNWFEMNRRGGIIMALMYVGYTACTVMR